MNTPNKLTILRVIMIPFFVFFMLADMGNAGKYTALVLFIAASLTDTLDGYLARKYNQVTNFGKFMDPLADKLSGMFCVNLSDGCWKTSKLGSDCDHQPGVYHQRIPSGGI